MKKIFKYMPLMAAALFMTACQNNDEENFGNKAYINASSMSSETIIKGDVGTITKTLNIETARPVDIEISATIAVDKNMLSTYNKAYYSEAELLPEANYEVVENNMTINIGSVKSSDASINFYNLGDLDRSITYVLPVVVKANSIEMLSTAKVYYYVFRAGSLINVVADIENNYLEIYPWATVSRVNNMSKVTMEALVYPREFGQLISSIMGIEGKFLIRIGDAGIPDNQIQIATSSGNFTDAKLQLTPGVWTHVAMTYDSDLRQVEVYLNGHLTVTGTLSCGAVNISGNGTDRNFEIGRSYEDGRDLNGCISEVRVWDVVRSADDIAKSIYTVDPTSEGLVAYWKFDDQASYKVKDYTGNGNDITAIKTALTWKPVSLPAAK